MEEYNDLSNKSDSFILNIVKQKENYSSDFYKAALKIFEERRLSIENAELIFKQRKDEINTLKDMIINGKSKEEIRMALNKSYIHPSEIDSLISSTYKVKICKSYEWLLQIIETKSSMKISVGLG